MTDSELIHQILDGNIQMFRLLIDKHKKQVISVCYGFTQSLPDAEDIAQEVFVEVYESLESFRNDAKFSTWIYRIAVNKSLNFIRKEKRRKIFKSFDDMLFGKKSQPIEPIDETPLPDDITNPEAPFNDLKAALEKIPKNQRVALTLYTYQELSYKQISEIMGISLSSVESLIFRSKKSLRKILVDAEVEKGKSKAQVSAKECV